MRSVQMSNAHRLRPVTVNAGVDAPLQWKQGHSGIVQSVAVDIEDQGMSSAFTLDLSVARRRD